MHPVLPFMAQAGGSDIRVDLKSGHIRPANPRTVAILLANTWVAGKIPEIRHSVLADSILIAESAASLSPSSPDLSRIMGALHLCGKAFGGDLHPSVPETVRGVVDGYHAACRLSVLRDLGLPEAPEGLLPILSRSAGLVASGALDDRRKLLPGRADRLVSAFVALFRVKADALIFYADTTRFVSDRARATRSVDLKFLFREGRAITIPKVGR